MTWWNSDPVVDGPKQTPDGYSYFNANPKARDLVVRTVLGEAANEPDEGMAAVASVIRNRADSGKFGKSIPEVVLSRNQFEPWNTQQGRSRMFSYSPDSPHYRRAAAAVDSAFAGNDPTGGATHFFAPQAQAALGRQAPSWAKGEPMVIGRHNFYAPEGKIQRAGAPQSQPTDFASQPASAGAWWASDPISQPSQVAPAAQPAPTDFGRQAREGGEMPALADIQSRQTSPAQQMAIGQQNLLPAAEQGTTPNISAQSLISADVRMNDAGFAEFPDPQTGKIVEAQGDKHVVLTDPSDNRMKVFARSQATNESAPVGLARVLAPGLVVGAPVARPAVAAAKNIQPAASDIFATAKPHYRAFDAASGAAGQQASGGFAQRIKDAMRNGKVPKHLADEVYSSVDEIGEGATLAELRDVKELIGQSARSNDSRVRQAAGIAAKEINKIIGEVSQEAGKSLKTADEIFSTAKSVQDLQRKEAVAGLRAGRAGYGGNAVNTMRQVLSPIVEKAEKGLPTGLKPNEIKAARDIVVGDKATNALRLAGQLSPTSGMGVIKSATTAGSAMYAGLSGGAALAIPAIGMASNKLATILTGKQIDKLKEMVAKRSPAYAEAVAKATERFERAQIELINNPGPNRLAAYVSASRALASGLQRDGIQITSANLIRHLQGPMRGATDDEKPETERIID